MIISGTGTRQLIKNPTRWSQVADQIDQVFAVHDDIDLIVSGGAEGFDELLAWRAYVNEIPYALYIPNPTYADYYWKKHSVTGINRTEDFRDMILFAATTHYVCQSIYVNGEHSNFIRNKAMIDVADLMIVCSPITSSGTGHAYKYILDKEVSHIVI